jgi:hypothetical protein
LIKIFIFCFSLILISGCGSIKLTPEDYTKMPYKEINEGTKGFALTTDLQPGNFVCYAKINDKSFSDFYCQKPLEVKLEISRKVVSPHKAKFQIEYWVALRNVKTAMAKQFVDYKISKARSGSISGSSNHNLIAKRNVPLTRSNQGNRTGNNTGESAIEITKSKINQVKINTAKKERLRGMALAYSADMLSSLVDYEKYIYMTRKEVFASLLEDERIDGFFDDDEEFILKYYTSKNLNIDEILKKLTDMNSIPALLGSRKLSYSKAKEGCDLEIKFSLCSMSRPYTGGLLFVNIELKNTGDNDIDGLVMLNKIPKHVTFVDFVFKKRSAAVIKLFLPEQNLIYWQLNCPLGSGESYKTIFALKLDPWRVGWSKKAP